MLKFLGFLVLLGALAAGCIYYLLYLPYGPSTETFVDIPAGTTAVGIGSLLERQSIIRSRYGFDLLRAAHPGTLKAGEYRFDAPVPLTEVYARLLRGDVYTRSITIPEGFNIFDIAPAVEAAGLGSREAFLAAEEHDTDLIADLDPHATSLEGYLFPDTYRFARHTTPEAMLSAMVRRFRQKTASLAATTTADAQGSVTTRLSGLDARTVILASLIEKEVREDSERPLVAGVFMNRLAAGMPLATDPTVIYAALLEGRYRGTIYASDLQSPSAYNTYRHTGLPPGPICNPGMAALRAAVHPANTPYLYFVSDANGHTQFSTDLKQHTAQVQQYRRAQQR